jgi:penicillin-binding protein 2
LAGLVPQPAFGFAAVQVLWSIALLSGRRRACRGWLRPAQARDRRDGRLWETAVNGPPRSRGKQYSSLNRRTLLLGGAMAAMFAVLGARMRYLQVDQADEFKLLAEENRINIRLIPPGARPDPGPQRQADRRERTELPRADHARDGGRCRTGAEAAGQPDPDDGGRDHPDAGRGESLNPFVPVTVAERLSWEDFSKVAVNAPALPGVRPKSACRAAIRWISISPMSWAMSARSAKRIWRAESPIRCCDPEIPDRQDRRREVDGRHLRGQAGHQADRGELGRRVMRELDREEGTPARISA